MPLIRVELFPGRTAEVKAELARRMTQAFCDVCGASPAVVSVIFTETAPEDWFTAGENLAPKGAGTPRD